MIIFCSKCGINWHKLHTHDADGDEQYDLCPVCRTNLYLQPGNDIVAYIFCPITGKITDPKTGEGYKEEKVYKKPVMRVIVGKPERETIEQREERELKAINAYHDTGSKQAYFDNIKKVK